MGLMWRAARFTLNLLTVLCSALCAVTVALWAWSYVRGDAWYSRRLCWEAPYLWRRESMLVSGRGGIGWIKRDGSVPQNEMLARLAVQRFEDEIAHPVGLFPRHWGWSTSSAWYPFVQELPPKVWDRLGFQFGTQSTPPTAAWGPGVCCAVVIPYWFVFLVAAAVPAGRAVERLRGRARRRRRTLLRRCVRCGYDLRGSSGQCPECGERAKGEA
jgi:hypothetical protein